MELKSEQELNSQEEGETDRMNCRTNCGSVIRVKVVPRSSRNQIVCGAEGVYRIKLSAAPIEGKANVALRHLLSKRLRVPKRNIEIISGERSRLKSIRIKGLSAESIGELLTEEP